MTLARTVVVTQSNYLPWRGWFDMVRQSDVLVLLDTVQFTRRDWRNRNRIKTAQGPAWLTIPVVIQGRFKQAVDETHISAPWAETHLRGIALSYARARKFSDVFPWLEAQIRAVADEPLLTCVNEALIRGFCERLGIDVLVTRDSDLLPRDTLLALDPSERLAALAEAAGGTRYISGPMAQAYLEPEPFARRGIEVAWMDYSGYPEYPQLWGDFEPAVSIVDLMLNTGAEASQYLGKSG
ncbi:WbqC family protein [Belnapia sp. F-4-1]|uniref:WbqC family protein n=1 Tax=Belnapia sp. F-4-1 TaxID=1545443 RepID=UPI0005BC0774|nr:WbqC family protein [Belnapia sp. F-4-1]